MLKFKGEFEGKIDVNMIIGIIGLTLTIVYVVKELLA